MPALGTVPTTAPVYGFMTSITLSPPAGMPAMRIFSCSTRPVRTWPRSAIMFMAALLSLEMIECQVEGVEVAPTTAQRQRKGRAIGDQRHSLLGDAAVGTQRHVQPGKVVPGDTRSKHRQSFRHDHQVADSIGGQLEPGARVLAREHQLDTADRGNMLRGVGDAIFGQVYGREGSQRAVMNDIRVGDGKDDARKVLAEPGIEQVLKVHDVWPAKCIGL